MNGELYHRLLELQKVLQLHFSDLGDIIDYQFEFKTVALLEPMHKYMHALPESDMHAMISPFMYTGELFTLQLKFKPKRS